jgi:hypothetical protein
MVGDVAIDLDVNDIEAKGSLRRIGMASRPRKFKAYHYSVQPFLAWTLNHHFYDGLHFTWAATPFFPYRLPNPKSSNPYEMYSDLYQPWKDRDLHDRFVDSLRVSLRKGVLAAEPSIGSHLARRLKHICARIDLELFYPIVYRIDLTRIPNARCDFQSGSAAVGSQEVLIGDLSESEFDILFGGEHSSTILAELAHPSTTVKRALKILEGRCMT